MVVFSPIEMKNHLIQEGRFTDAVDDALLNVLNTNKKYINLQEEAL